MNVLLIEPHEVDAAGEAEIDGRRCEHVVAILKKGVGETLAVGLVGGRLGEATILALADGRLRVACRFDREPPPKRLVTLVLALPRPPVLRRVLQHVATMGVPRIVVLHTRRVEKSYWQSPALREHEVRDQLLLGLEQGVDTIPPEIETARRFRPFVEDRLPELLANARGLVADPSASLPCPVDVADPVALVVGPEGGFIPHELDLLRAAGCELVGLGTRVLRVETAIVALLARLGIA